MVSGQGANRVDKTRERERESKQDREREREESMPTCPHGERHRP